MGCSEPSGMAYPWASPGLSGVSLWTPGRRTDGVLRRNDRSARTPPRACCAPPHLRPGRVSKHYQALPAGARLGRVGSRRRQRGAPARLAGRQRLTASRTRSKCCRSSTRRVLAASWWRTQRSAHTSKLNDELEGLQRASLPAAAGHFHHRAPTGLTAAAMVSPRTCSRIYYDVDTDVAHRRPRPGEAHMRTCPGTTWHGITRGARLDYQCDCEHPVWAT